MHFVSRPLVLAGFLAVFASLSAAQVNSNNVPLNNGGDAVFFFSSPSSGFSSGTNPPDIAGDWYYKVYTGAATMNHVTSLGSVMEVDGFYESLFDTFWGTIASPASSSADFYDRTLGPALPSSINPGILEPAFVTLGLTSETVIVVGGSGFGNPCTIAPSLCTPPGSTCPPTGFVNGYLISLSFSSTPGSGVILPADGTPASDTALTHFVTGGMTATGGICGLGDYGLQDLHSTDETQADLGGTGANPDGGLQLGGVGPLSEAVTSMLEAHLTFRARVLNMVADTGTGLGVEGGGATNGIRLSVGSGLATLGVEIRAHQDAIPGNVAVACSSFTPLPNPGVSLFGGQAHLLLLPDGLCAATSAVWTGTISPTVFTFTSEGAFVSAQIPVPAGAAGITLYTQGLILNGGPGPPLIRSTNRTSTTLGI